jgi:hypothetical protein
MFAVTMRIPPGPGSGFETLLEKGESLHRRDWIRRNPILEGLFRGCSAGGSPLRFAAGRFSLIASV